MTARTPFLMLATMLVALTLFGCATEYRVRHTTAVTNMTRITSRSTPEIMPEISSDGQKVVFAGLTKTEEGRRNNYDIWVTEPYRKLYQYMRATDNESDDYSPVWGPQGKVIVFDSDRTNRSSIWEKPSDGIGGARQITGEDMYADYVTPDISRHGDFAYVSLPKTLAVRSMVKGRYANDSHIWLRNYEGGDATELCVGVTPKWSPDGTKIVFSAKGTANNYDIWVIDKNGANLRQLTSHPANDIQPTWSPDGKRIAFASNRAANWVERLFGDKNYDIWVMNATGGGYIQLTNYSKFEGHPSWSVTDDIYFHTYGGWFLKNWDIWRMTLNLPGPKPE